MKERIKNVLNFKKPSLIIIVTAVLLAAALTVGLALSRTADSAPVKATVTANGKERPISIDRNENPPYVQLGSLIKLQMDDRFPDTIHVTDIIANPDGSPKYDRRLDQEVAYTISGNTISFAVESNWAVGLSSNSEDYKKGNSYRWYRVQCGWKNGDQKEYAIYVRTDPAIIFEDVPSDTYEAREWLDYYLDEQLPWDGSMELNLPEYPSTTFRWTSDKVTAVTSDGETILFSGMPVWNVYLADLTDDGLPELCATVSFGSGIVDNRVLAFDYADGKLYELSDRMLYDYVLSLENGSLIVTLSKYNGEKLASGDLAITNGELTAIGIDRTGPEQSDPSATTGSR